MIVTNKGQTSYPFGRFLKNNLILLALYQILSLYQVSYINSTKICFMNAHNWWAYKVKSSVYHIKTTKQETTKGMMFLGASEINYWTYLFAPLLSFVNSASTFLYWSSEIHFVINSLNKSFSPADVYHSKLHEALAFCFKTGGKRNKYSASYISSRSDM